MNPVITAWSAFSPFGAGADAFRAGIRTGVPVPGLVPGFDTRAVLGRKGTRSMDRVSALSVAVTGELTSGLSTAGLVLGTTGSVQSTMDFTRSSLEGERPFYVDAARFPSTVMNCAAGQCAIWHQLKGPNATVAGGRVSGLLALNYARRLQASGRAGTLLCGGAEEYSAARAQLSPDGTVLGEGAAMLRLDPPGTQDGLADVVALEFGVHEAANAGPILLSCLRRALDKADAKPGDIGVLATDGAADEALAELFNDHHPERVPCATLIGDTAAAAATFQILAVLTAAEDDSALAGRLALVTAVDHDGSLGCALLRLRRPAPIQVSAP